MIIVKLQGGLGNQMFQYALGRSLSLRKNTDLFLDISSFEKDPFRTYVLAHFSLNARFAKEEDMRRFARYRRASGPFRHVWNFFVADWKKYTSEKQFHFDHDVFDVEKDAYLEGYWNTEKYFKDIRDILLADFMLTNPPLGKNKEAAERIEATVSVSIHVRRGDYANDPKTNHVWGTLDNEYYDKARNIIERSVPDAQFFVFSDDIPWVKTNLNLPDSATFVDWNNTLSPHEDLRLMLLCKHNIIANSTFSWWGAWLNTNKDKIVIAPERWFNTKKISTNTKDVIPEGWIKI